MDMVTFRRYPKPWWLSGTLLPFLGVLGALIKK